MKTIRRSFRFGAPTSRVRTAIHYGAAIAKALLLVAAVAPACDIAEPDDAEELEPRAEDDLKVWPREQMLCDQRACFIHRGVDFDHDGVADVDELMLGTDPTLYTSRPTLGAIFRTLPELPTLRDGSSMLLLLPAFTPFGKEVFGGADMLPVRKSLLDEMGIALPDELGLDMTGGLALARSVDDANAVAFSVPPWLVPAPPEPDTTADADAGGHGFGAMGKVLGSIGGLHDFQLESFSQENGVSFEHFSMTGDNGETWDIMAQWTTGYDKVEAMRRKDAQAGAKDPIISVTEESDEHGTVLETTTTSKSRDSAGVMRKETTTITEAKSADGKQTYYSSETKKADGTVESVSKECYMGVCTGTSDKPTPVEDEIEDEGTAYVDPDYMEYTPSPEVMDSVMVLRAGPVMTVNPLDADEQYLQYSVGGLIGNDSGTIVFYANDGYATTSDPIILHLPPDGDEMEGPPEEGPAPTDVQKNGQCMYCNQGG